MILMQVANTVLIKEQYYRISEYGETYNCLILRFKKKSSLFDEGN